jgi:hypothetical protein
VADGGGLENRYGVTPIVGSNPTPSARSLGDRLPRIRHEMRLQNRLPCWSVEHCSLAGQQKLPQHVVPLGQQPPSEQQSWVDDGQHPPSEQHV